MTAKPVKIALINAKGGTSKTCSTQNLAHALASKGKRVLAVDFDPQGSLTYSFGIKPQECDLSIADVLFEGKPISKAIRKTSVEGLDLVPGALEISSFDVVMSSKKDRETKLQQALAGVKDYDYVLVDPAPTASLMMVNVMLGVDHFIIPVVPQYLALEGLALMMNAVEKMKETRSKCASLLGILLTQVDGRSKATTELIQMIRKHYGKAVFNSEIKVNVRLSEAPSFGRTIFQHAKNSPGAVSYKALGDEVIKRISKNKK